MLSLRKQVLATRGLGPEDFKSEEDFKTAADAIIQQFKDNYPEKVAQYPDKLFPGFEQLDQFWCAEYKGIGGTGIWGNTVQAWNSQGSPLGCSWDGNQCPEI